MTFNWNEFFTLARSLFEHPEIPGPLEAALRSSASRAYYAVFHCALIYAKSIGYIPTYSGNDHKGVQSYLRECKPPNDNQEKTAIRKKMALELDRLYDKRRLADYHDRIPSQPESLAAQSIEMAQRIFVMVERLGNKA